MDFEAYRHGREHTTHSLQRDMARQRGWAAALDRMRSGQVVGCLFVDSKRLKAELEPVTAAAQDGIKRLLADLARERCRSAVDAFTQRVRLLEARPGALDKFAG